MARLLDACHRSRCRKPSTLISLGGGKAVKGRETKQWILFGNGEWCGKHTLSTGSGRTTNNLVGNPREIPAKNQKMVGIALGRKGRNPMNSSSIKGKEVAMNWDERHIWREEEKHRE